MPNLGAIAQNFLGFDVTPGFNINRSTKGVPFVAHETKAPTSGAKNTNQNTAPAPSGTYSGDSGSGISAEQQAANNQAIGLANYNLGLLPQQLNAALGNVQNTFNQKSNELQSGYNAAEQNYGQSTDQNKQSWVTNKNTIMGQASNGLNGLLRLLGQHGAGGSSAIGASQDAVSKHASQQFSGAGQTYGQNQQTLDTNWGNYRTGFDNSKRQLNDWLGHQQNAARSENEGSRQTILQQLASLQSNAAAAQPYIDQIKASAQHVANLAAFNPSYTGVTPVYTAPDVASYSVGAAETPTFGTQGNNTGAGSTISYLLGLGKDRQQNPTLA